MPLKFAAALAPSSQEVLLERPLPLSDDPAAASDAFSVDELFAVDTDADELPAGSRWRVLGRRTMARHGSSALDTEIGVTLLAAPGSEVDADALLSSAMMRLALALATTPGS